MKTKTGEKMNRKETIKHTSGVLSVSPFHEFGFHNDGSATLSVADGEMDRKPVCNVLCHKNYKRGHGHKAECETRDANSQRIIKVWNCHDDLLAALKWARTMYRDNDESDLVKAMDAAIRKAEGNE